MRGMQSFHDGSGWMQKADCRLQDKEISRLATKVWIEAWLRPRRRRSGWSWNLGTENILLAPSVGRGETPEMAPVRNERPGKRETVERKTGGGETLSSQAYLSSTITRAGD